MRMLRTLYCLAEVASILFCIQKVSVVAGR